MNEHQNNLFLSILDNNLKYFAEQLQNNFNEMNFNQIIDFDNTQNKWLNNYKDYSFGYCCLAMASRVGNLEMVKLLLDSGCKPNNESQSNAIQVKQVMFAKQDDNSLHPVYVAYENKRTEVLQFFLEKNIKFIDKIKCNYVHLLVMQDSFIDSENIVADKDINHLNCFRDNILHVAVLFDRKKIVAYILEQAKAGKGVFADMVNAVNNEGNTPLHLACLLDNNDVLKVFLQNSERIKLKFECFNNNSATPLDIANNNENKIAVELLAPFYDASDLLDNFNQRPSSLKFMACKHTGSQGNINIFYEKSQSNSKLSFFNLNAQRNKQNTLKRISQSSTMSHVGSVRS